MFKESQPGGAANADQWSDWLALYAHELELKLHAHKQHFHATDSSALLFRLGSDTFCVPSSSVREVVDLPQIHWVPGVKNKAILGLANFRGELLMCASLARLLRLPEPPEPVHLSRLLVLSWRQTMAGFPADQVLGVCRFSRNELRPVPGADTSDGAVLGLLQTAESLASALSVDALFSRLLPDARQRA